MTPCERSTANRFHESIMTVRATCPQGHSLTVEDKLAGKKIRCPRCQAVFLVPDLDDDYDDDEDDRPRRGRAREDDDDDDRPRRKARRPVDDDEDDDEEPVDEETRRKLERQLKKKQLKLVDVGLLLHFIKLWMYVAGMLFGIAALIMFVIAGAQHSAAVAEAGAKAQEVEPGGGFVLFGFAIMVLMVFLLNLFIFMIGPLLGIVGSFLCCWIPKKSEARGTIIMSLTFDLVSLVAWLLALLANFGIFGFEDPGKRERMVYLLRAVDMFCLVASWLTFLTFLRGLGKYLGEPGVGNEALNLIARLVVQVISLFGNVLVNIASAFMLGGVNPFLAIAVGIVCILIWTVFFIFGFFLRLIKLISAMRRAVQNKL
jgi:hypothetical protein